VRSLLASLVYMSPVWAEVDDAVTVQVWDGARFGSGCLQESTFKTTSVRQGCCASTLVLRVRVGDYAFERTVRCARRTRSSLQRYNFDRHVF